MPVRYVPRNPLDKVIHRIKTAGLAVILLGVVLPIQLIGYWLRGRR